MTTESTRTWTLTPGRCGACRQFEKDFGSDDSVFGHCPVKPRSGSIQSSHYKCEVYEPIEGIEPAEANVRHYGPGSFRMNVKGPAQPVSKTSRRPSRKKNTTVLRRRSREERDRDPITWGDMEMDRGTLRQIIREAIEDSLGITDVEMVDRFVGGEVTIQPGVPGTQEKSIPIDTLFRKIVMVRDCLRVLEQKINTHPRLDDSDRVHLQQYVTRAYGSLTTFNMLFKDRDDKFSGSSRDDD